MDVIIRDVTIKILLDTGADISTVSFSWVKMFPEIKVLPWIGPVLRTATGTLSRPIGMVSLPIELHSAKWDQDFAVIPGLAEPIILGVDAMRRSKIIEFRIAGRDFLSSEPEMNSENSATEIICDSTSETNSSIISSEVSCCLLQTNDAIIADNNSDPLQGGTLITAETTVQEILDCFPKIWNSTRGRFLKGKCHITIKPGAELPKMKPSKCSIHKQDFIKSEVEHCRKKD